jgi:hypothetical protein
MDHEIKDNFKKFAEATEVKLARSLLRWKYRREGRQLPEEYQLENRSRELATRAHNVISKRGKNVWDEFKRLYKKDTSQKEGSGQ